MISIHTVSDLDVFSVIQRSPIRHVESAEMQLHRCLMLSVKTWIGHVEGEIACLWGLIPPTLLSDQAYLWLLTTDLADAHKFLLVRHSQRVIETMLREYPTIVGHCEVNNDRAIRWIGWLGGTFGIPEGRRVPFMIRAK